ncbi:MAG: hypothetical protein GY943_01925 [Chloroflexi bacterium]|nr:hypothetical protein [Chloroflexota bacterium]
MAVAKDKKRFPVTVPLVLYKRLREVSRQRGVSMSFLAGELLIERYGHETAVSPTEQK